MYAGVFIGTFGLIEMIQQMDLKIVLCMRADAFYSHIVKAASFINTF